MKLSELLAAVDLFCPAEYKEQNVTAVVSDTRQIIPGCLFVCIRGFRTDTHLRIPQIAASGVAAIFAREDAELPGDCPVPVFRVEDTRSALSILLDAWYGFPSRKMKFIGVTGTNGKTSVTHMIRSVLEASLYRCGLIGTVGCESAGRHLDGRMNDLLANMTTPDPPELYRMLSEMVGDGVEYVVMEVTSHALALGKLAPIRFAAAVFTNLTPEHLDFHKTMEAYAEAKAALFEKSDLSVINLDSPYAQKMLSHASGRRVTCSQKNVSADYLAEQISPLPDGGAEYILRSGRSRIRLTCPIPGNFSVINSMQAAVCAMELGIGAPAVKDALASVSGVRGRMEKIRLGFDADFAVMIDYAHTPDALENLLRTARSLCRPGGRLVLVFGCGGDRDRGKRPLMGRLAEDLADLAVVTSDNSRGEDPAEIIRQILSGMRNTDAVEVIPEREAAIRRVIRGARRGDVILLAGKGHEEYEIDRNGRRPFSERDIVYDEMKRRQKNE